MREVLRHKPLRCVLAGLVLALALGGCKKSKPGSADAGIDIPDAYVGACHNDPVPSFQGDYQVLLSSIQLAGPTEGFDLNYDGTPDNLLGILGTIANGPIDDAFQTGDIMIPLEFFGVDSGQDDDCLNFAFYISRFPPDMDGDREETAAHGDPENDCNDHDPQISSRLAEVAGDFVDNDCDGMADETADASGNPVASTDTSDRDGDGVTLAQGDCDDRLPSDWPTAPAFWDPTLINPNQPEICGDGFDNNCDGRADEGCNPFTAADGAGDRIELDQIGLTPGGESLIVFRSGRIVSGKLIAGPSRFNFSAPIQGDIALELNLTAAYLEADVMIDGDGLHLSDAKLGGVLNGQSLDRVPNIASDFFGAADNSMLDVIVGPGGQVLSFPSIGICRGRTDPADIPSPLIRCDVPEDCGDTGRYRCDTDVRAPDIDVDQDGQEIYLDVNLDGDPDTFRVDTCIDGDGTVFQDTVSATGLTLTNCTEETDGNGNPRFVDGYSVALKFSATPTIFYGTFDSSQ